MQRCPAEPNAAAVRWLAANSRSASGQHDGVVLRPAEGLDALAGRGGALVHVLGDRGRADERDRGDVRVVEDRVDRDLVAVHDVEHAVGQAGLGVELGDQVRRRRVALARLEHEGVAGGDGHRVHPQRHHDREVERRDPGDHAEGLAEVVHVDVAGDLVGEAALERVGDAAGVLDDFAAAHDLAAGVVDDLAVFAGDDPGQLVLVLHQQLAEGEHHLGALGQRGVAPRLEGLARGGDRGVHIGRFGEQDLRPLPPGGRVVDRRGAGRARRRARRR